MGVEWGNQHEERTRAFCDIISSTLRDGLARIGGQDGGAGYDPSRPCGGYTGRGRATLKRRCPRGHRAPGRTAGLGHTGMRREGEGVRHWTCAQSGEVATPARELLQLQGREDAHRPREPSDTTHTRTKAHGMPLRREVRAFQSVEGGVQAGLVPCHWAPGVVEGKGAWGPGAGHGTLTHTTQALRVGGVHGRVRRGDWGHWAAKQAVVPPWTCAQATWA